MARPDPEFLQELSDNVAAIARRIVSPKNDPEDMAVLAEALNVSGQTLETVAQTWTDSLDK